MDALLCIVLMMKRLNMLDNKVYGNDWSEVQIVAQYVWDIMRKEACPGEADVLRLRQKQIVEWSDRMEDIRRHCGHVCMPSSIRRY